MIAGDLRSPQDIAEAQVLILDATKEQLSAQLSASDSFDAKSLGFLALIGVLITLLVGLHSTVFGSPVWLIPMACLVVASVAFGLASSSKASAIGPDISAFYRQFGSASPSEIRIELISSINRALRQNGLVLEGKATQSRFGIILTLISFAVSFLLFVGDYIPWKN